MVDIQRLRVPTQSRSQRTRKALVEAARSEFDGRGYALTTAKSIADRARVGTGTFYHYFPDKDAVLREITVERAQFLMTRSAPHMEAPAVVEATRAEEAKQRVGRLVRLYVEYHRADRGLHSVISERRLCDAELDGIMTRAEHAAVARLSEILEQWGFEGDSMATAFVLFSLLEGAVHAHVLGQPIVSDARFETAVVEAMLRIAGPGRLFSVSADGKERS